MTQTQNSVPLKRYYNSSKTKIFSEFKNVLTTKRIEALIGYLEGDSKKSCCCVGMYERSQRNGLCLKLGPNSCWWEQEQELQRSNENNTPKSADHKLELHFCSQVRINKNVVWWAPSWCEPDIMNWRGTPEASFFLFFLHEKLFQKSVVVDNTGHPKNKSRGIKVLFVKGEAHYISVGRPQGCSQ